MEIYCVGFPLYDRFCLVMWIVSGLSGMQANPWLILPYIAGT